MPVPGWVTILQEILTVLQAVLKVLYPASQPVALKPEHQEALNTLFPQAHGATAIEADPDGSTETTASSEVSHTYSTGNP